MPSATAAATGQQELLERAVSVLGKIDGLDDQSLAALCKHYGFSYSHGECKNAKGSVPIGKLLETASCHYSELGDLLTRRRSEVAKLEKQCGKKAGKLKSKLATYTNNERKLESSDDAPEIWRRRQQIKLDKISKELSVIERSLYKIEDMDEKINAALTDVLQKSTRTDVSIVKGKSGYRLSANISKTISPDSIIRAQQYVWTSAQTEDDDEGIDL